jgi:transcriptional regulator with XRE-family HTH domain
MANPAPGRWSPTVRRQRLAHVLAGLRAEDGRSAAQIAQELGVADSTVTRLENAKHLTLPKAGLIDRLLRVYNAGTDVRERVRALVDEARQRDWWHQYKPYLPPGYATYLGLEPETAVQRLFQFAAIPGILQTAAYAAEVFAERLPDLPEEQVEAFAAERRRHQAHLLDGPDPIRLWVVLGEAALHQAVGGPRVMAEQFDYLCRMMERPHVTVTVLPFAAGAHAGAGPFRVLTFPEPTDPEVAYLPDPLGGHWVRDRASVDHLVGAFEDLMHKHPDRDLNMRMIADSAERFRSQL